MSQLHALAIDVETTGLDPTRDAVVELAAVGIRIDPATGQYDALRTLFTSLVDPGRSPAAAPAVHHLTARDVQPDPAQALAGVLDAVQAFRPHLPVAHNADFDNSFLPGLADALNGARRHRIPGPAAPGVQTFHTERPHIILIDTLYVPSAASAPEKDRTDDA